MNLLVCSPAFIGVFSAWLSHSARQLGRISLLVAAAAVASLQTEGDVHPIVITQPAEVLGLGTLNAMASSADGKGLLTGGARGAFLWAVEQGKVIQRFVVPRVPVHSVAVSPDGTKVLTGSGGGTTAAGGGDGVARWEVATGRVIHALPGHTANIPAVAFSPDGRYVLTGDGTSGPESPHNGVRLWSAATGKLLRTFDGHLNVVQDAAFFPDGSKFVTVALDYTARVWDVATGAQLLVLRHNTPNGGERNVMTVAVSPDGARIFTGGEFREARLWDAASGVLWRTFAGDNVYASAFSPDGSALLTGGRWDGVARARVRSVATGSSLRSFQGNDSELIGAVFLGAGDEVALAWRNGELSLRSVATGAHLRSFEGHSSIGWAFAMGRDIVRPDGQPVYSSNRSPDGKAVLTFTLGEGDMDVVLRDAQTREPLQRFAGHSLWVRKSVFSPDGRFVLTGGMDKTARLWDAATGTRATSTRSMGCHGVGWCACSPCRKSVRRKFNLKSCHW